MTTQILATRRGTVLIAVLVCMGIATSIFLGSVQTTLRLRREARQELQLEQTKWLTDLGVRRGLARLQDQPDYEGETLTMNPRLEKYSEASIAIEVVRKGRSEPVVTLQVTARLKGKGRYQQPTTQRSVKIMVDSTEDPG